MTPHITLYPHQKDAVWRIASSGNTSSPMPYGKTNVMVAAGMKMKQAGLITKPSMSSPIICWRSSRVSACSCTPMRSC